MEATVTRSAPSLDEWLRLVGGLEGGITAWCEGQGWAITRSEADVRDARPHYGSYVIPVLSVETPDGRLFVEPTAHALDGTGLVQLYAWPTLFRVRLLYRGGVAGWEILTDSGIPWHEDWNEKTFLLLAHDLLNADY